MVFPDTGFAGQSPNAANLDQSVIFQKPNFASFPAASGLAEGTRFMDAATGDIYRVESATWVKKSASGGQAWDQCYPLSDEAGALLGTYNSFKKYWNFDTNPWTQNGSQISVTGGKSVITVIEDSTNDAGYIDLDSAATGAVRPGKMHFTIKVTTANARTFYLGWTSITYAQTYGASSNQDFCGVVISLAGTNTIGCVSCNYNNNPQGMAVEDSKSFTFATNTTYYCTMELTANGRYGIRVYSDAAKTTEVVNSFGKIPRYYAQGRIFKFMNKVVTNAGNAVFELDELYWEPSLKIPKGWYHLGPNCNGNIGSDNKLYCGYTDTTTDNGIVAPITLSGNWTIDIDFNMLDWGQYGYQGNHPFLLHVTSPKLYDNPNYCIGIAYSVNAGSSAKQIYLTEIKNGVHTASSSSYTMSANTTYYFRFAKTGGTGYSFKIFASDANRTADSSPLLSTTLTGTVSYTYDQFVFASMFGRSKDYAHQEDGYSLSKIKCTQLTVTGEGATLDDSFTASQTVFDLLATKKVAGIGIKLDVPNTSPTHFTLVFHDTRKAVRYLPKSDFTDAVTRYILTQKASQDIRYIGISPDVALLDILYKAQTADEWRDNHFHKKLSGTMVEAGVDRN